MSIIPGRTKIEKFDYQGQTLYFKREDQNPSGSFKDRLVSYIWGELTSAPETELVVPSSGNFAISLLYHKQEHGLAKQITVFAKDNLPQQKQAKLTELINATNSKLVTSDKAKSAAIQHARENNARLLRASEIDDYANAYKPLASEIIEFEQTEGINFDAVVICCSSGTAAQGLLSGLIEQARSLPVFIVQTSHINTIANEFDQEFVYEEETVANAISDRIGKRKPKVIELLKQVGGGGVVADNSQVEAARAVLTELLGVDFTGNAALSLAGFLKLQKKGYNFSNPLIIISGN